MIITDEDMAAWRSLCDKAAATGVTPVFDEDGSLVFIHSKLPGLSKSDACRELLMTAYSALPRLLAEVERLRERVKGEENGDDL